MKNMKKLASLLLALVMVFSLATTAFAATVTIPNAAYGEEYEIYKLFDATVNADGSSIAYTGTIPESLSAYFTKDGAGNISETADARNGEKMSSGLEKALEAWTKTVDAVKTATGDGTPVKFEDLGLGYYVVTTSQGDQLISVDSVDADINIYDKNTSVPKNLAKETDDHNYKIGDTVTYTVSFETANYTGSDTAAKKIVTYTIEDNLPDFLDQVNVSSIIVDNDADTTSTNDQTEVTAQFENKKIDIDWYNEDEDKFLYENGAKVIITYTAVVTEGAAVAGSGNTNTVTLSWEDEDGDTPPDKLTDSETIYTYALALKKINEDGTALAGATFEFPFYVKETPDTDGAYIYAGTDAGTGLVNTITTPATGDIVVKGLESDVELSIKETAAPAGYNKLTAPVKVTPVQTSETTTSVTKYLDEQGNVIDAETDVVVTYSNNNLAATVVFVVNKSGTELPTTGGMGTTLFYVFGSIMVIGAAVLLVTKKRMGEAQ